MYLGVVIGTCVATRKIEGIEGLRLLVVQPVEPDGTPAGAAHVACDAVQAGPGDLVYLVGSREASMALPEPFVPVDAAIVGIVDDAYVAEEPGGGTPAGGAS